MNEILHTTSPQLEDFTKAPSTSVIKVLLQQALAYKKNPYQNGHLGKNKTLVLLFLNPSLRTRLSTQKAAFNLGMSVIDINANEGWKLEFEDNIIMDGDKAEHIREAANVISQYADFIGLRSFPSLTDKEKDYSDFVINKFKSFATVPVISLESAIRHPLQSLADLITIEEHKKTARPKVVLTWAPHPKALPQAVPNSFAEWMNLSNVDLTITHPKGYELDPQFSGNAEITYDQEKAFEGADFIYAKNWSSYADYGQIKSFDNSWMITPEKMALTNTAHFMHCLPVRRNVVVADQVLDSDQSLVIQQSENRVYAAQAVLSHLLSNSLSDKSK
jgi:N-succinyl-L-ornithine transcarbamylase